MSTGAIVESQPVNVELPGANAAPPQDGALTETAQPEGEGAPEQPEDGQEEGGRTPEHRTARYRFSELTRQIRALELKNALLERGMQSAAPAPTQNAPGQPAPTDPKPDPRQYPLGDMDPDYNRALGMWQGREAARQEWAEAQEAQRAEADLKARASRYHATLAEAQKHGLSESAELLQQFVAHQQFDLVDAITETPAAPLVAYYYAANPEQIRELQSLDPIGRVRQLERVSIHMQNWAQAQGAKQPAATATAQAPTQAPLARTAHAPQPTAQPTPTLNRVGAGPNANPASMSPSEYWAWRQANPNA